MSADDRLWNMHGDVESLKAQVTELRNQMKLMAEKLSDMMTDVAKMDGALGVMENNVNALVISAQRAGIVIDSQGGQINAPIQGNVKDPKQE